MKPEFQKLLDITLIDGILSEKERNVLRKKGESIGMTADEVDIIVDARLYEINRDNNKNKPVDNTKCPKCGEQLTGVSVVCPACNFVTNNSVDDEGDVPFASGDSLTNTYRMQTSLSTDINDLEQAVRNVRQAIPEPYSKIIKSALLILFSSGLYILYKKLLKREALFNRYEKATKSLVGEVNRIKADLCKKYKDSPQIMERINNIAIALSEERKKWNREATVSATLTTIFIGAVGIWALQQPKPDTTKQSAEDKTEKHIEAGHIGEAKKSLALVPKGSEHDEYAAQISNLEIDSLVNANDYLGALKLAATIKDRDGYDNKRDKKITEIVKEQVDYLCEEHRFKDARDAAELVTDYTENAALENTIALNEKIYAKSKK